MGLLAKIGAVILTVVLVLSLAGANVTLATDRTVLNGDFVTNEFAEQGVYENVTEGFEERALGEFEGGGEIRVAENLPPGISADPIDPQEVVSDAITTEYVQSEVDRNILRFYAFLHGETDRVNASLNLTPVKESLQQEVEDLNVTVSASEAAAQSDALSNSQVPVSGDDIASLEESEQSFQETRTQLRVDVIFQRTPDAELLRLIGEDPNDYADNSQGVRENEAEIRSELRSQAGSYEDLPPEAQQRLSDANQDLKDQTAQQLQGQDQLNENLTQALTEMQFTVIDGLTGDITYDEYTQRLSSAESDAEAEIERMAQNRIDERFPQEQITPEQQITRGSSPGLDRASTQVQRLGLLKWGLILLSIVLIGLIALVTRSFGWTTATSGFAMSVVGGIGVAVDFVFSEAVIRILDRLIQQQIEGGLGMEGFATNLIESFLGVVESAIGTFGTQSLVLLVLGIILIVLAILNRIGLFNPVWRALGLADEPDEEGTTAEDTGADEDAAPKPAITRVDDSDAGADSEPKSAVSRVDDSGSGADSEPKSAISRVDESETVGGGADDEETS